MKGRRVMIRCWPGAAGTKVGSKDRFLKAVEMLTCIKADRGSGEEGNEKLPGEKGKLIMSGSGASDRKWNPKQKW